MYTPKRKIDQANLLRCPLCNTHTATITTIPSGGSKKHIIPTLNCHYPSGEAPRNGNPGYYCESCFQKLNSAPEEAAAPPAATEPADLSMIDTIDEVGASFVIWPKIYCRKHDKKLMLYLNTEDKHTLAISENNREQDMTDYQRKILQTFLRVLKEETTVPFTGSYDTHSESKNRLSYGLDLYSTTHESVGGQEVPENGVYLAWGNKLFQIE